MMRALETFVNRLSEKQVLKPLYKNRNMTVKLASDTQTFWLIFADGQCRLEQIDPPVIDVSIEGDNQWVVSLVNGDERMTRLIDKKDLDIKGSNHCLLALESLFILAARPSIIS